MAGTFLFINPSLGGSSAESGGGVGTIVEPSAGGAGITAAVSAVNAAGGGTVQLRAGTYDIGEGLDLSSFDLANIRILGEGPATVLDFTGTGTDPAIRLNGDVVGNNDEPIDNVATDDPSFTVTTAANASAYEVGDIVVLTGTNSDTSETDHEIHEVETAGNPGTGVVELIREISHNLTSVTARAYRPDDNVAFENFSILRNSAAGTGLGFSATQTKNLKLFGISIVPSAGGTNINAAIQVNNSLGLLIECCSTHSAQDTGFDFAKIFDSHIDKCTIENTAGINNANSAIQLNNGCKNVTIERCNLKNSDFIGILVRNQTLGFGPLGECGHILINRNYLEECENRGIDVSFNRDCKIENNTLAKCSDPPGSGTASIDISSTSRCIVEGNIIKQSSAGIRCASANDFVINDNIVSDSTIINEGIAGGQNSRGQISNNTIRNTSRGVNLGGLSTDISVNGNVITGPITGAGILMFSCSNVNVSSNVVDVQSTPGANGIELNENGATACTNCSINNNTIKNGVSGIQMTGVTESQMSLNRISGCTNGINMVDGATITTDENSAINNHLRGNTSPIVDTSTGVANDIAPNKT